jgi:hypothetical protein
MSIVSEPSPRPNRVVSATPILLFEGGLATPRPAMGVVRAIPLFFKKKYYFFIFYYFLIEYTSRDKGII